jgi:predicted  nucleic acid-binding Zn-ribbon protein
LQYQKQARLDYVHNTLKPEIKTLQEQLHKLQKQLEDRESRFNERKEDTQGKMRELLQLREQLNLLKERRTKAVLEMHARSCTWSPNKSGLPIQFF